MYIYSVSSQLALNPEPLNVKPFVRPPSWLIEEFLRQGLRRMRPFLRNQLRCIMSGKMNMTGRHAGIYRTSVLQC